MRVLTLSIVRILCRVDGCVLTSNKYAGINTFIDGVFFSVFFLEPTRSANATGQVVNLIVIILYRTGYGGDFLGAGGTWNLNEEKNPDVEIVASGVFVGFFIYTAVQLIAFCFGTTKHKR